VGDGRQQHHPVGRPGGGALADLRHDPEIGVDRQVGPWSSRVATGTRATRSSAAARRTSGQVRRS
jgi:hypothetical protein